MNTDGECCTVTLTDRPAEVVFYVADLNVELDDKVAGEPSPIISWHPDNVVVAGLGISNNSPYERQVQTLAGDQALGDTTGA